MIHAKRVFLFSFLSIFVAINLYYIGLRSFTESNWNFNNLIDYLTSSFFVSLNLSSLFVYGGFSYMIFLAVYDFIKNKKWISFIFKSIFWYLVFSTLKFLIDTVILPYFIEEMANYKSLSFIKFRSSFADCFASK